jgi:hypothetical protein
MDQDTLVEWVILGWGASNRTLMDHEMFVGPRDESGDETMNAEILSMINGSLLYLGLCQLEDGRTREEGGVEVKILLQSCQLISYVRLLSRL